MKSNRMFAIALLLAGMTFMQVTNLVAQDQPPQDQPQQGEMSAPQPDDQQAPAQDPPGRAGRLSYSIGSVSFQPGGQGDWVQAVQNRPLTSGDNLWADKDSRAEFQVGSTSFRIDSETSVTLLQLDDRTTQLRLSQGSIIFRIRHLDDDDHFEIDTPNSAFEVQRTGEYRLDVVNNGNETDVTVWRGRGEVTGGGDSYVVVAGQRAQFTGTDDLDHEIGQIPAQDDFDAFAFQRDQREDRSDSSNYISNEVTGYEDLDEYGHWHYVADYGPVWTPAGVAGDWAPYRYGHWVWVSPWGWTWVEDEPWGFAPFHYGRWAYVGGGWCWVPGPVVVRPVFAPALVAFVGGVSVGVGVGPGVGWFPLAPREVFVPWYRTSRVYVNNVNITNTRVNVTNITNVYNTYNVNNTTVNRITYVNQRNPGAVTVVSRDTFVGGRPVAHNIVRVDARQIEDARVTRTLAVQPTHQSVLGVGRPATFHPPATVVNRQVVATRMPTVARPGLEQREGAIVRTEKPGAVQSPGRAAPAPGRPAPESGRADSTPGRPAPDAGRPAPNPRFEQQGSVPRAQEPPPVNRGVPRPPNAGGESARVPSERPNETQPRAMPRGYENDRPMVRSAPPVQERPERQQSEQRKFDTWQQHYPQPDRSAPPARTESRPSSRPSAPSGHTQAPPHDDRSPKK